jgi:hypothetical protein
MRGSAEAVRAAMNTTTIAVHRVVETDIGTVVVRDDFLGLGFFKDLELYFGGFANPFH